MKQSTVLYTRFVRPRSELAERDRCDHTTGSRDGRSSSVPRAMNAAAEDVTVSRWVVVVASPIQYLQDKHPHYIRRFSESSSRHFTPRLRGAPCTLRKFWPAPTVARYHMVWWYYQVDNRLHTYRPRLENLNTQVNQDQKNVYTTVFYPAWEAKYP